MGMEKRIVFIHCVDCEYDGKYFEVSEEIYQTLERLKDHGCLEFEEIFLGTLDED